MIPNEKHETKMQSVEKQLSLVDVGMRVLREKIEALYEHPSDHGKSAEYSYLAQLENLRNILFDLDEELRQL